MNQILKDGRDIAYWVLTHLEEGVYGEDLLNKAFAESGADQRERSLAMELTYGVTRWQLKLDYIIAGMASDPKKGIKPKVRVLLRLGLYQIFFCDRIPDHAAVDTTVERAKYEVGFNVSKFINALLRKAIREKEKISMPDKTKETVRYLSIMYSHPEWLVKRWLQRFGPEDTARLCNWNNRSPLLYLRANKKKTDTDRLYNLLEREGFTTLIRKKEYIGVLNPGLVSGISPVKDGSAWIQDPASGLVVQLLNIMEQDTVLDLCAAPGGKSLCIAERTGSLIAADSSPERIVRLRENFLKYKVSGEIVVTNGLKSAFKDNSFDKVLVDAPCSNTGVLARRPESRWLKSEGDIIRLAKLQMGLLKKAAPLVKAEGVLVYSTCSLEPEEDEKVVEKFLRSNPEFAVESAEGHIPKEYIDESGFLRVLPFKHEIDGMFGVRLRKVRN